MLSTKGGRFVGVPIALTFVIALVPIVQAGSVPWTRFDFDYNFCVGAQSYRLWTVFEYGGPADKTWMVRLRIGLVGGDTVQYADWFAYVSDDNLDHSGVLTEWSGAGNNWVEVGAFTFADTQTAHVGGTLTLRFIVFNVDPQPQCFGLESYVSYIPH